jgi:hypothetical protein
MPASGTLAASLDISGHDPSSHRESASLERLISFISQSCFCKIHIREEKFLRTHGWKFAPAQGEA